MTLRSAPRIEEAPAIYAPVASFPPSSAIVFVLDAMLVKVGVKKIIIPPTIIRIRQIVVRKTVIFLLTLRMQPLKQSAPQ